MISILPPIILFFLAQKHFVQGVQLLAGGAVASLRPPLLPTDTRGGFSSPHIFSS